MSFYKSKRSNPVVAEGKENTPVIDHSSSPPPMTEEDNAYPPLNIAQPLPCEPDMEVDGDEYSDDPHSDDTSYPTDNETDTIDDERCRTQRPLPIPVVQDHDIDEPQDNALTSSSYADNHDGIPSSYDDDPPQESRSRSLTPTPRTPRARSFDEDTEMPLSSPIRAEIEAYSSSQEMPPLPEGGDNPTSMACLAEGHNFNAVEGAGDGRGRLGHDDDAPLTRLSQESIRTDYSPERLSSPSLEEEEEESQPSQESIRTDYSHERSSSPSEEDSTSSQPSRAFPSSQSYQEWSSTFSSSSHSDEDTTPRSSPRPSSSSSNDDADDEMDPPYTPMMSEAGRRSPTSSEPSDWDDDDDDDEEAERRRRRRRRCVGDAMSEERDREIMRRSRGWRRSRGI